MKNVLIVVVLVVAGLLAYNFATTGELSLVPSFGKSAEARDLAELQKRFDAAKREIGQAHRTASMSGVDTTGDVRAVLREIERIADEVEALEGRLTDDAARSEAAELRQAVRAYLERLS